MSRSRGSRLLLAAMQGELARAAVAAACGGRRTWNSGCRSGARRRRSGLAEIGQHGAAAAAGDGSGACSKICMPCVLNGAAWAAGASSAWTIVVLTTRVVGAPGTALWGAAATALSFAAGTAAAGNWSNVAEIRLPAFADEPGAGCAAGALASAGATDSFAALSELSAEGGVIVGALLATAARHWPGWAGSRLHWAGSVNAANRRERQAVLRSPTAATSDRQAAREPRQQARPVYVFPVRSRSFSPGPSPQLSCS